VLPLLLLLVGLQDNSQLQSEVNRLQSDVRRLNSELNQTRTTLQNELRPMCSAESRLQSGELKVTAREAPIRVNFFGMVSAPSDSCLPANIAVSATYVDPSGAFVCGGTATIPQQSFIQNTLVELLPYDLEVFLRWWDGATLKQQTLICRDYRGIEMRDPAEFASSLKIFVSLFPKRGGISTAEFQVSLPRFPRQE